MTVAETAWIGVGSNIDGPVSQVLRALDALAGLPSSRLLQRSSLYRSAPMGPQDQPDFINAVVAVETTLEPLELLHLMQDIERRSGRRKLRHWGERSLDLDMLLFGGKTLRHPRLVLPHPGIPDRAFVLYPLAELDPTIMVPGHGRVSELLDRLPASSTASIINNPEWQV
ncbi:MAG: 2-amino-4-hydroxy-6-hydroxymethyldihydropteridine diphosphokinase [Ectothiorhodospiraceae bacterium]|nr:2-amino-4-hydroxy-6-hydroxymethyldihydropteridine diphosphokinase [Ectothiorhodospiraceae bacterium]